MLTTNDNWSNIVCGNCKWFSVNADRKGFKSDCKRLDHKYLKFSKSCFESYNCGQFRGNICSDFYPAEWVKWLYDNWEDVKRQKKKKKKSDTIGLCLNGDFNIIYKVNAEDFYNNTFQNEDGNLKWLYKIYLKVCKKSVTGYKIVKEYNIDN